MRDEHAPQVKVASSRETVGDVIADALLKAAAVLLLDAHFSVLDLNAGAQAQEICAQHGDRRAAAALFHVLQLVEDEARPDTGGQLVEAADDFLRLHAAFGKAHRLEHHKPVAGGEIARVNDVDVVISGRRQTCVLIAGGKIGGNSDRTSGWGSQTDDRQILLDREDGGRNNGTGYAVPLEEYLIGLTAVQIPDGYPKEAVKAQAILARTALYREMDGADSIEESALDMDYLEPEQIESRFEAAGMPEYYQTICGAVRESAGQTAIWAGDYIEPLFHAVSAGRTREGDEAHPYLASVAAKEDEGAGGYLTRQGMTREELKKRLEERLNAMGEHPDLENLEAERILEDIQIVKRDSAGYVETVQIGAETYSGDAVRYALGVPSPAFSLEEDGDEIRCVTYGRGHGYGLSQYGAGLMAENGSSAEEILKHYFKNIQIVSE